MFAVVVLASAQGGKSLAPVLLKLLRPGETPIVFLRDIDDPPSEIDNLQYTDQLYMPVTKLGYQSTLVTTGAKALEEMAQQNFAFVLIDCMMPEMDGFETARRIREAEKDMHYRHKLLAVSANPQTGDETKAKRARMDEFIAKPLTVEILSKVIGKWHSF